ncbi:S41 family peptidase [Shewanella marina]|uniref:S41 family peptidase n=1 Tax=Shewanella marina TaxID=487319 RepID=UPI00046EC658|nr:S41 family peptidase [Shewanella marina]
MRQYVGYLSCIFVGITLGLSITLASQENTRTTEAEYSYPLLLDILETIETYYVDQVSEQQLIQAAIKGIFTELDPYSTFLAPDQLLDLQQSNKGEYFGFGLEIDTNDGLITVVAPYPNSPAAAANIKSGDHIIKLNDAEITADNLTEVLALIRLHGQTKQTINLTLDRKGQIEPVNLALTPAKIIVDSMKAQLIDDIAYLKLTSFQESSHDEISAQLKLWQQQPIKGIILDLRNNPGGLLDQAISIADLFLDNGRIVSTEGRIYDANSEYFASKDTLYANTPMIVLINQGSASAAEVLAAALQENNRAKLLGQKSFGKGTVQSLIPTLIDGNAIKLTIAKYNTPSGSNIHKIGIEPDIKVNIGQVDLETETLISTETSANIEDDYLVNSAIIWLKSNN